MNELIPVVVLIIAILIDWRFGDLPNSLHPVVAMGNWISWTRRKALQSQSRKFRFVCGAASLLFGIVMIASIGWAIERLSRETPIWIAICFQAVVLKCTFSIRSLGAAASSVASALNNSDLALARQQLAYHLVSRDTSQLDASSVAAAAVESVAENTSDSFIAPLIYFAIAGLPGALVYRYVNTCDAMLGYRTRDLEWLGKSAARTDDLLNWIPSRVTAILMLIVGPASNTMLGNPINRLTAISIWMRDSRLTASPNAGHPMSAAAGLLGVVLEKHDHYRLGDRQALPTVASIRAVNSLLYRTSMAGICGAIAWLVFMPSLIRGSFTL